MKRSCQIAVLNTVLNTCNVLFLSHFYSSSYFSPFSSHYLPPLSFSYTLLPPLSIYLFLTFFPLLLILPHPSYSPLHLSLSLSFSPSLSTFSFHPLLFLFSIPVGSSIILHGFKHTETAVLSKLKCTGIEL